MAFDYMAAIESVQSAANVPAKGAATIAPAKPVTAAYSGFLPPVPPTRTIALPASERIAVNEANGLRWGKRWAA